jgi:tRNA A-37 threonylcarbamoyl transferase component Bud32
VNNTDSRRPRTLALDVARRLDPLCDRFEDELLAGRRPRLEAYLDGVPASDQPALLRELLGLELDYRTRRGERPQAEEYRQRLPELANAIEAVFADRFTTGPEAHSVPPPEDTATHLAPSATMVTNEDEVGRAGRYEIEEEIARGGMGVVLRVRDPDLNRTLAVKVLREDLRNRPEAVRRFREEAQITGQLQHPGIPPVHEVGTLPDGRPFFAMKLVKGRTLAALLKERPAPAHDRPRFLHIFEQVCQTVAYAHSKGIIHRDLKPANVMVGAFGEVQVMDWGLAKVLSQPDRERPAAPVEALSAIRTLRSGSPGSETQAGSVMGTPAYMPPEQALGLVDRLDRRSDVFGLGAILCELLTGQPPYVPPDGDSALLKAIRADLADAFGRLDGCGADPELVALAKGCLAVEPNDRKADAGEVAEGVAAYLAGVDERLRQAELERAAVEVKVKEERKRRRLVVGLAVALIVGTAGSIYFAFKADRKAKDANDSAEEARIKEREANEAREQTEATLAWSLLRPLGHREIVLNDVEVDALWELAESPSDRVRMLFVENAVATLGKARQLRNRAELALHAIIGLDRQRRVQMEGILLGRLRDASMSLDIRKEIALAVAQANPSSELAVSAARFLSEALVQETDSNVCSDLARGLSKLATRLDPHEAARHAKVAARKLAEALAKETNQNARSTLMRELSTLATRLGPEEATALAQLLLEALAKETRPSARECIAQGLDAVVARLAPHEAARHGAVAVRLLTEAMTKERDGFALGHLAEGLSMIADRVGHEEAARHAALAASLLAEALAKESNNNAQYSLARGLSVVATRIGPQEAATTARLLTQALAKETSSTGRYCLARGLRAVATRLDPEEATRLLSEALAKETDPSALGTLAEGLSEVVAHLGPEKAACQVSAAARILTEALAKETDSGAQSELAQGLSSLAAQFGPEEAVAAARVLTETLAKEPTSNQRSDLARGLSAVLARLGPEEAARYAAAAARILTEALAKEKDSYFRSDLVQALSVVLARLSPKEAEDTARILTEALALVSQETDIFNARIAVAEGLSAVAARLSPEKAARILTEALAKETYSDAVWPLAQGLVTISVRLGSEEAVQRSLLTAQTVAGTAPLPPLMGMAAWTRAAQPLPSRLSTQELVDFLKMPTCVGKAREPFLQLLGERYNQSFTDQWEFVEYAEKHLPDLDLKSSPKRPGT